jgi:hypothetical protein
LRLKAVVVIDNVERGPSAEGLRMAADVSTKLKRRGAAVEIALARIHGAMKTRRFSLG